MPARRWRWWWPRPGRRRSTRSRRSSVDFDELPVHVETAEGGPAIHPEAPDNLAYDWAFGDEAEVGGVFAAAAHAHAARAGRQPGDGDADGAARLHAEWDGGAAARRVLRAGRLGAAGRARRQARACRKAAVRVTTPGRRRRLRDQGLQLSGVFRRRLRGARTGAAGALDEHPRRGDADRQRRARPRDGGRGGVRRRLPAAGDADRLRLELGAYNSPYGQHIASKLALKVMPGRLRRAEGVLRGEGRLHQHHAGRRLSRRRAAGGDLRHRAADGLVGARPRARPGRAAAAELHPEGAVPLSQRLGRDSTTWATSGGCSTGRSIEADVAGFAARKAASARAGRLRGLGLCYYIEFDPRRPERDDDDRLRRGRHGRAARRDAVERPGARDGVRADPASSAAACRSRGSASCRVTATGSRRAAAPAGRGR